jgi:hypothetical protein
VADSQKRSLSGSFLSHVYRPELTVLEKAFSTRYLKYAIDQAQCSVAWGLATTASHLN